MPRAHPITGVRGLTSETYFNQPPVEWGRAGGAVKTIAVGSATGDNGTGGGTDGAVADKATTTDGGGSGLVVDITIASNVATAIVATAPSARPHSTGGWLKKVSDPRPLIPVIGCALGIINYLKQLGFQ